MIIDKREYNPELHEIYKALTVKQPNADLLTCAVFRDDAGAYHAAKTIEVRSQNTKYRGELLICSSAAPVLAGRLSGVSCGLVELYDVKPVEEFTDEDWGAACLQETGRPRTGWGWLMRNPRRVVEIPVSGRLGIFNLIVPKGDIMEYPRALAFGADGWEMVQKKLQKNGEQ